MLIKLSAKALGSLLLGETLSYAGVEIALEQPLGRTVINAMADVEPTDNQEKGSKDGVPIQEG